MADMLHPHELQRFADHDTIFRSPEVIGCPGCVDEVIEPWELANAKSVALKTHS